jgi:hypothetical protein
LIYRYFFTSGVIAYVFAFAPLAVSSPGLFCFLNFFLDFTEIKEYL